MSRGHNPTWYRYQGHGAAGRYHNSTDYDKENMGSLLRVSIPPREYHELQEYGRLRGVRLG